jgi:hypothetical protein
MDEIIIPDKLKELSDTESLRIIRIFAEIGLDLLKISPAIVTRLKLLNRETNFLEDEHRATHYAKAVFDWYKDNQPKNEWTETEKKIVTVGTMFSDIGKTGPRIANEAQQELIVQMYGIENVEDPKMRVADFIVKYFHDDAQERINMFRSLNLDDQMTMRSFWDLHVFWTYEIIIGDGVPPEAVAAAATHHFIQGLNPQGIVGENGKFKDKFGDNASFDRAEKLVILLDKYDAYRRRGGKSNLDAVTCLKGDVARSQQFADDTQFAELIDVIEFTNREQS